MAATTGDRSGATRRKTEGTVGQETGSTGLGPGLLERLRGRLSQELNEQKERVTDSIDGLAATVRRVSEPLRDAPYPALAQYGDDAAVRLRRLATDLRERDVEDLAADLGHLARRRPAVFLGAGFAAGVLAARLLRSTVESADWMADDTTAEHDTSGRVRRARTGEHR